MAAARRVCWVAAEGGDNDVAGKGMEGKVAGDGVERGVAGRGAAAIEDRLLIIRLSW
jgi:hypothetical protein